jgi:predicted phosphodiesterase
VVIGDTGCRLKASDHAYQACNDPAAYPFARIAASAAAWRPDLVIHVGDLLYRENACPERNVECAGSPWGYGWDAWDADLFTPAASLFAVAPWIMVRGNHESCNRAGQGWWRFVDPSPIKAGRDCNSAGNDAIGNESATFAIPIGGGAQVIVMDLASAGEEELGHDDPRATYLRRVQHDVITFAKGARFSFAVGHYPLFGLRSAVAGLGKSKIAAGNQALISVFRDRDPALHLPGVDLLLSGHIHTFEQVDLGKSHPSQFVSGMSGTLEDQPRIDAADAERAQIIQGLPIKHFSSDGSGFGFLTLERTGPRRWKVELHSVDGAVLQRCSVAGRRSHCHAIVPRFPSFGKV